jgi:hypothetical protein
MDFRASFKKIENGEVRNLHKKINLKSIQATDLWMFRNVKLFDPKTKKSRGINNELGADFLRD